MPRKRPRLGPFVMIRTMHTTATCPEHEGSEDVTEHRLTMEEWEKERLGGPASELTPRELEKLLPRRDDLSPPPFRSRLGGRIRRRLRPWPSARRAEDLQRRAERFLAQTPAEPPPDKG
jgi:hypothetical protein